MNGSMVDVVNINGVLSSIEELHGSLSSVSSISASISVPSTIGIRDYNSLKNKPSVESMVLEGDRTFPELGISNIDADDLLDILS